MTAAGATRATGELTGDGAVNRDDVVAFVRNLGESTRRRHRPHRHRRRSPRTIDSHRGPPRRGSLRRGPAAARSRAPVRRFKHPPCTRSSPTRSKARSKPPSRAAGNESSRVGRVREAHQPSLPSSSLGARAHPSHFAPSRAASSASNFRASALPGSTAIAAWTCSRASPTSPRIRNNRASAT